MKTHYTFATILILLLSACETQAVDYLKPKVRLASPDMRWNVWVKKHLDQDSNDAEFFISKRDSSKEILLEQNCRHFGAEWSPNSKILLIYNNYGSGSSFAIIYYQTHSGWKRIYSSPYEFHIEWRLDQWLSDGVRLRPKRGGSGVDVLPKSIILHFKLGKK